MKRKIHPEAEAELFETIDWNEGQEPGLGTAFAAEVLSGLLRIQENPSAWPMITGSVR